MAFTKKQSDIVRAFYESRNFSKSGSYMLDLDGTTVFEKNGDLVIEDRVKEGLIKIYKYKNPIIINSLRSPKSIINKLASKWFAISNVPIPVILLNGSFTGLLTKAKNNIFYFNNVETTPLTNSEIEYAIHLVKYYSNQSIYEIHLVCYYTDWTIGEKKIIITKNIAADNLRSKLSENLICMIYLEGKNIDGTKIFKIITHDKVNKLLGAEKIVSKLKINLSDCLGAGDSLQDTYLNSVGMAVHINNINYKDGDTKNAIFLKSMNDLGELLIYMSNIL